MRKNFVVKFLVSLVVFFLFVPSVCFSAGLPFYKAKPIERQNLNEVLSTLIQKSLEEDPSGNKPISAKYTTTPNFFLEAIQKNHPSAKLGSIEELSQYIRSLEKKASPKDDKKHQLARIVQDKKGRYLDFEGWKRKFYSDELVWFDINTGEDILAGYCANVIIPEKEILPLPPPPVKEPEPVVNTSGFEFCSEYVAQGEKFPVPPYHVCSATDFVELRWSAERVPIVYGICDKNDKLVYNPDVEIILRDNSSDGGANFVQSNNALKLNRQEGCTQVMVKRGNDYQTFKPFSPEETDGSKSEIHLSVENVKGVLPLAIPWEVDVNNIPQNEVSVLDVQQTEKGIVVKVSIPSKNFVSGVLRLVKKEGRQDRVIYRTNPREDGSFVFENSPKGKYLITFSQPELRVGGEIYLKEKNAKEIEVK